MTADDIWWAFDLSGMPNRDGSTVDDTRPRTGVIEKSDYRSYLSLAALLTCQSPLSAVPDERAFLLTHQVIELIFKLVLFDLTVVTDTIKRLTEQDRTPQDLLRCLELKELWHSALSASSRLQLSCRATLPLLLRYVDVGKDGSSGNFNRDEFLSFREKLGNASGMQSSQFRLIQKALGKSPLLTLRLFPNPKMVPTSGQELVAVSDTCILADSDDLSSIEASRRKDVVELDSLAHELLARFAVFSPKAPPALPMIKDNQFENAVKVFQKLLPHMFKSVGMSGSHKEVFDRYRADLRNLVDRENIRRTQYVAAAAGAAYLKTLGGNNPLLQIFRRLSAVDEHLHGRHHQSLLSIHLSIAKNALRVPLPNAPENVTMSGTGGGTIEYLGYMRKHLIPMLPVLIAFRDGRSGRELSGHEEKFAF